MAADGEDEELQLGPFAKECGVTLHDLSRPDPGKLTTIKTGLVFEILDKRRTNTKTVPDIGTSILPVTANILTTFPTILVSHCPLLHFLQVGPIS